MKKLHIAFRKKFKRLTVVLPKLYDIPTQPSVHFDDIKPRRNEEMEKKVREQNPVKVKKYKWLDMREFA